MDRLDMGCVLGMWMYICPLGNAEQQWESKRYTVQVQGMVWLMLGKEAVDPGRCG